MNSVSQACGVLAALFAVGSALIQIQKVFKDNSASGIPLPTYLLQVLIGTTWLAYSIVTSQPAQVLGNVLWFAYALTLAWVGHPALAKLGRAASVLAVLGLFAALLLLGWMHHEAPGWIGMPASLLVALPQIFSTAKSSDQVDGNGVSALGWLFVGLSSSLWVCYGIGENAQPVIVTAGIQAPLAFALALLIQRRKYQASER